jgi:hypothetical protein
VSSKITVRYADSSEAAINDETRRIFKFLVPLHREAGFPEDLVPFDYAKALHSVKRCILEGAPIMAEVDGELVGFLGLMPYEHWYSSAPLLADQFFYIRPDHRNTEVFERLLAECRAIAEDSRTVVTIVPANLQKAGRPARNGLERIASALSYIPRGSAYMVAPARDAA